MDNTLPLTATKNTYLFPVAPSSVQLSGNSQITANGINTLQLTCISGTANPSATITWRKGQTPISSSITRSTSQGDYGGTVITEKLTLKPTREMDGVVISCTTSNTVNYPTTVKKETSLDLKCKFSKQQESDCPYSAHILSCSNVKWNFASSTF